MSNEEFSNHVTLITDLLLYKAKQEQGGWSKLHFLQLSVSQLCLLGFPWRLQ